MRTTFRQLRLSRFPRTLGLCSNNVPEIAAAANECQQRLINDAGETGWWGGWAKVAFTASMVNPYITLPPQYARAIGFDVCRFPIRIQNEFYEELDAGIGLRGPNNCVDRCAPKEAYDRGTFPTMIDLAGNNQLLRVYITDPADVGKRILISNARDQNGNGIYTQDGAQSVNGFYLQFEDPFVTSTFTVTSFQNISKDQTVGDIILKQVDASSGNEVTLSRYAPNEENPACRRYYLSQLPFGCCNPTFTAGPVVITAMCKYEFVPVETDTDFLIIGNIPAMIEEGQAVNYSSMETPTSMALETRHHARAVKLLNDELRHYLGENLPAINFAPYGTARLDKVAIGMI